MSTSSTTADNNDKIGASPLSLPARLDRAVSLVETSPIEAARELQSLQPAAATLFSANESLDDLATSTLPFLSLEHHLAMALQNLPMTGGRESAPERLHNLQAACDLWHVFLERLLRIEVLSKDEQGQLEDLMELSSSSSSSSNRLPPSVSRETKIARAQAQHTAKQQAARLQALRERRSRLGVRPDETVDGYDDESLARSLALTQVTQVDKSAALESWSFALQELPLLARMTQKQQVDHDHRYKKNASSCPTAGAKTNNNNRPATTTSNKPLQVTQITQDPATGQLRMARQEIRANVVRPGWNQPTMTMEELAQKEVAQALEREARQKQAQAQAQEAPRRYEQLVKDGMEDRADLVDASAALDRQWDAFKDENPRGSGNKRGDVGDRNF